MAGRLSCQLLLIAMVDLTTANLLQSPSIVKEQTAIPRTTVQTSFVPTYGLAAAPTLDISGYPVPTVPPTEMAPFMQRSQLPENFVFILVGSIIGVFFVVIVLWRSLVAWRINRIGRRGGRHPYNVIKQQSTPKPLKSIQRATPESGKQEKKGLLSKPRVRFYGLDSSSSVSFERLRGGGDNGYPCQNASRSSLFFSPTAASVLRESFDSGKERSPADLFAAKRPPAAAIVETSVGGRWKLLFGPDAVRQGFHNLPLHIEKTGTASASFQVRNNNDTNLACKMGIPNDVSSPFRVPGSYPESFLTAPGEDVSSTHTQ